MFGKYKKANDFVGKELPLLPELLQYIGNGMRRITQIINFFFAGLHSVQIFSESLKKNSA
jgi:hypothetical protein